jgi:hypothetical protein
MKLLTIWTMPKMALSERLRRTGDEWFLLGLAYHLPRRLTFWVLCRVVAEHSYRNPQAVVPEISVDDLLRDHPAGG